MPHQPPSPCREPGCAELVDSRKTGSYCRAHVRKRKNVRRRTTERRREMTPEQRRFEAWYASPAWRGLRKRFIAANPTCAHCQEKGRLTPADIVDHIVERKDDDSKRLEWSNLQSLCHSCHNIKTARERRRRLSLPRL